MLLFSFSDSLFLPRLETLARTLEKRATSAAAANEAHWRKRASKRWDAWQDSRHYSQRSFSPNGTGASCLSAPVMWLQSHSVMPRQIGLRSEKGGSRSPFHFGCHSPRSSSILPAGDERIFSRNSLREWPKTVHQDYGEHAAGGHARTHSRESERAAPAFVCPRVVMVTTTTLLSMQCTAEDKTPGSFSYLLLGPGRHHAVVHSPCNQDQPACSR